jgi:hypothetical protein
MVRRKRAGEAQHTERQYYKFNSILRSKYAGLWLKRP